MLKKRLIGVITVKDGWAVQSFGYQSYLPLGKPDILAENLDRWGADEIIIQCIDRSKYNNGPDLQTLSSIARKGLGTPIIYAGGIHTVQDGLQVIQSGADRIAIDTLLHNPGSTVTELSYHLGAQAIIGCIPATFTHPEIQWYNYCTKKNQSFSTELVELLRSKTISEIMLVDWQNEGITEGFQSELVVNLPFTNIPIIAFGGLSSAVKVREILGLPFVVAAAVGNFLNYQEHAVDIFKQQLIGLPIRRPHQHQRENK
jgi:cyclase